MTIWTAGPSYPTRHTGTKTFFLQVAHHIIPENLNLTFFSLRQYTYLRFFIADFLHPEHQTLPRLPRCLHDDNLKIPKKRNTYHFIFPYHSLRNIPETPRDHTRGGRVSLCVILLHIHTHTCQNTAPPFLRSQVIPGAPNDHPSGRDTIREVSHPAGPTSCWVRERGSNLSGSQPSTSSSEIGHAVWGKSCLHSRQHFLLVYSPAVNTEAFANTTPGSSQYLYIACWWSSLCLPAFRPLSYPFVLLLL